MPVKAKVSTDRVTKFKLAQSQFVPNLALRELQKGRYIKATKDDAMGQILIYPNIPKYSKMMSLKEIIDNTN